MNQFRGLMSHKTLVLFGGNQHQTQVLFGEALKIMNEKFGREIRRSSVYESTPWGFKSDHNFLNMVVEMKTNLTPDDQLQVLLEIEAFLGRKRKSHGEYESRGIDLDILFIDNLIIETPDLTIPHPRLHLRRFTLLPLCEHWKKHAHPIFNKTMKELLNKCSDTGEVKLCR